MGLSRRKFTAEFKAEVVRRLELGASVAEVARACEVNPNVPYRAKATRRARQTVVQELPINTPVIKTNAPPSATCIAADNIGVSM
jgi:transposase-like protein